jgi:hypothetical protein
VSSKTKVGQKILPIGGYWPQAMAMGIILLICRHLVLNIFPFLLNAVQLIGEFSNSRRTMRKYVYVLRLFFRVFYAAPVLLALWFLLSWQVKRGEKKTADFRIDAKMHSSSPGKHWVQCCANMYQLRITHWANTIGAIRRMHCFTYYSRTYTLITHYWLEMEIYSSHNGSLLYRKSYVPRPVPG